MRIVIASDSFKESLSAEEAVESIAQGFLDETPDAEIVRIPMADGGEGTTSAVVKATGGRIVNLLATGPLGSPVECAYGISGDANAAVVEIASASGLELVSTGERNPLLATTYGTGEVLRAALDEKPKRVLLGLGGSATVDGGAGLLQALGARLMDENHREIGLGGGELRRLRLIDLTGMDARLRNISLDLACDVDNPLTGPEGAAVVFGPQKGATDVMVNELEMGLQNLAIVLLRETGVDVSVIKGGGAAGGTAAALVACLRARLRSGFDVVAEFAGLEEAIRNADLVITGEGRLDQQTVHGKTPAGVARLAAKYGKPVIAFAGSVALDQSQQEELGIRGVFSIVPGAMGLPEALAGGSRNLRRTARQVAAILRLGTGTHS